MNNTKNSQKTIYSINNITLYSHNKPYLIQKLELNETYCKYKKQEPFNQYTNIGYIIKTHNHSLYKKKECIIYNKFKTTPIELKQKNGQRKKYYLLYEKDIEGTIKTL